MFLTKLSVINYKNIAEANLEFCQGINCFIGNNGMGKTNILDAIYYLSFCKSHTNAIDTQNIKHEEGFLMLQGNYRTPQQEEEVYVGLKRGQKKLFKRNKQAYERLLDHIGLLPLVLVSPSDAVLIDGGSEERRKFVDGVISQYDKKYLDYLLKYNYLLQQRNALLKNRTLKEDALYEVCEFQMAQLAQYIFAQRQAFITQFLPVFQSYYNAIAQVDEVVNIVYKSHLENGSLQEQFQEYRAKDSLLGYTTKGVHKDELEMFLGEYFVKRTGSQGQNKTFLVALKLAQFDFLKKIHACNPILLLDDIFDKLDATRVNKIIEMVSGDNFGQIFITDTNRDHLVGFLSQLPQSNRIFSVNEQGVFTD
ncbi:MAG: DNA replication and repair protein RecF [Paludibacteraceae bacterium]|nr:DNA replication and repair protein RecF [Paludibacteraceae bacterium]MBP6284548.1 DNA replication and repair protein RecF [Paludibacteraceae bacterium]